MGRTDYIVQAGIGFDLDRSSAKKSIGIFESIATTMNAVSAKKSKEQYAQTEKDYDKSMAEIKATNKKADEDLAEGTKRSAQAAQQALRAAMPKKLSDAKKASMDPSDVKEYESTFKRSMDGMSKSHAKYVKEAAKLGIKVRKAHEGFGTGQSVTDFQKADVDQRKQLITLTKRMVKDEKKKLKAMDKTTKAFKDQEAEVKALEEQQRAMENLNDDLIAQQSKHDKIHRTSAKKQRKAENKKISAQKKIVLGLKNVAAMTQRVGQLTQASFAKASAGIKNFAVIGTAAATAFFVKMQPLAESVQEFEKTIINANSVFNVTKKELHEVSDSMVRFTLKYGVSAQETATGLYQLASAGLSAAESQEVLQHTMKLAMATQGDHNTLAKLTVQTIMGFGMEMSDTGMLVDKFAHSIQKSLIEWEDLASSVKFAMPFFVATGQSVDELLGGLEVLTNRALEAGIAGRGLRQALAQFTKHADDNTSALAKLGVEIMDSEGNMRALHEITLDAQAAFGDVTDLEALTAMLEDMNVRGATAFALLVQNADEFEAAVTDLGNSAGEATQMADIQQQSLSMQIQLVKNALLAPFLFADEVGEANNTLNEFTFRIGQLVQSFTEFFIIQDESGAKLTEHSEQLKIFIIDVLEEAVIIVERLKQVFLEQDEGLGTFTKLLDLAVKPMHIFLNILDKTGPGLLNLIVMFKVWNSILPVSNILAIAGEIIRFRVIKGMMIESGKVKELTWDTWRKDMMVQKHNLTMRQQTIGYYGAATGLYVLDASTKQYTLTMGGLMLTMGLFVTLMMVAITTSGTMSDAALILASAFATMAAWNLISKIMLPFPLNIAAIGVTMIALYAVNKKIRAFAKESMAMPSISMMGGGAAAGMKVSESQLPTERSYDSGGTFTGGRMYESGGPTTEHGMAILQKGETIIPKTRNMLGEQGITLNIVGDVYDSDNFAEKISEVLPQALRKQSDIGGI